MFKENDLLMYGKAGVCRVFKIGVPDFALSNSENKQYYFLEPLYHSGTFYAPVEGAKIALRPVISAKRAKSLISGIKDMEYDTYETTSVQQLSQKYQSVLDLHECEPLMAMLKAIHIKASAAAKNNKKLGQIDKRYMKMAEELLFGELACALGKGLDEVREMISVKLEEAVS